MHSAALIETLRVCSFSLLALASSLALSQLAGGVVVAVIAGGAGVAVILSEGLLTQWGLRPVVCAVIAAVAAVASGVFRMRH